MIRKYDIFLRNRYGESPHAEDNIASPGSPGRGLPRNVDNYLFSIYEF